MDGKRRLALVGVGLGLALAGCGTEADSAITTAATESAETSATPTEPTPTTTPDSPSATPTDDGAPAGAKACSTVWKDGAKLPRTYGGCTSDGQYIKRDVLGCSSGQRLVRYDEAFYAVLGGTISAAQAAPLQKDDDYRDVVIACRA